MFLRLFFCLPGRVDLGIATHRVTNVTTTTLAPTSGPITYGGREISHRLGCTQQPFLIFYMHWGTRRFQVVISLFDGRHRYFDLRDILSKQIAKMPVLSTPSSNVFASTGSCSCQQRGCDFSFPKAFDHQLSEASTWRAGALLIRKRRAIPSGS